MDMNDRYSVIGEALDWCKSVCDVASSDPSVSPDASEAMTRLMRCFGEAADEARAKAVEIESEADDER